MVLTILEQARGGATLLYAEPDQAQDQIRRFQTFLAKSAQRRRPRGQEPPPGQRHALGRRGGAALHERPQADRCLARRGRHLPRRRRPGLDRGLRHALFATDRGHPTGCAKATAVIPAADIGYRWTAVHALLCYPTDWLGHAIAPDTRYAIVCSQLQPGTARYEWAVGKVGGGLLFGKWNGSSWVDESGLGYGWLELSLIPRNP